MAINFILLLIFTLFNFLIAIFIYFKNPKDKINIWFGLTTLSVALWAFTNAICLKVETLKAAIFWSQISYISAILIAGAFLYFSLIFPASISTLEKYRLKKYHKIYLILLVPLISIITLISGFTIRTIILDPWKIITGPGLYIFAIYFLGTMGWAFYNLIKKYSISQGIERLQMKYLFLGAIISSLFGSVCNLILPLFGDYRLVWLGPIYTIFLIGFTTLAIIRYHLFEIRVILTELLVGVMGILLLVFSFLLPEGYRIFAIGIFLLFLIFAYYLVKATHEEAKRREEAEKLTLQERTLREKAEKVAKEFERISNIKDQMLLSSQHYWRTPLTGMKGFLDMILTGDYGELSPALKEKLVIIQKLSQTLHQRIEESIDITQFQIGKGMLNKEETQIEDFLNGVLEEFKPQLEERRLYLKTQFPKEKLPKAMIDQKRMRETYSNVIDNAIKHTIKGGITIILEFKPYGLKLNQPSILCLVKDTGIGISKEELLSIGTSPFERGEEAKKLSPMGKGVGLYLSRLIVEAHGGKLWIESEGKDKGTTIYIELPIK